MKDFSDAAMNNKCIFEHSYFTITKKKIDFENII